MSRMIPTRISSSCKSPGERMLFGKFRDDPETRNWIVLHSVDIARHVKQIEGEADFVILIPELGVLCLEVKAGDVSRRDGIWTFRYGTETKETKRSPFKQASDAMHSLRIYVGNKNALLQNILFISAVAFTKIEFREASPEWHQWQHVDRTDVTRRPVSDWCTDILRQAHRHVSRQSNPGWYDPARAKPSSKQIEAIAGLLRRDFEYFRLPGEEAREVDEAIRKYTENQFAALDEMEENPRTLFKGLAGTGKTLIALEAARRAMMDGKRVLFVCFNHLLGDWLRDQARLVSEETGGEIECGTLHSILLNTASLSVPPRADSTFWRETLPAAAIERVLDADEEVATWDQLIIDECQDFNEESYFDFLDLRLSGGLSAGNWVMFGDFDRQAIYGKTLDIPPLLRERAPGHTVFRLLDNCRNTFPIARSIELLCAPDPSYKEILHRGDAPKTEVCFYSDFADQQRQLAAELRQLLKVFAPADVVVLSGMKAKKSVAASLARGTEFRLQPLMGATDNDSIRFGSIHAYKGLDAAAVAITDIRNIRSEHEQSLLYVGMSRARQRLIVLLDEACRADYRTAIENSLSSD
jgi:hypothetical protein